MMILRQLLVLLCVLMLAACGKDPITSDLAAYDQAGRAAIGNLDVTGLNQKMLAAKTDEEKAAMLGTLATEFESRRQQLAKLTLQTPEGKHLLENTLKGLNEGIAGAKQAQTAFNNRDNGALNDAANKLRNSQTLLRETGQEFVKLAKEKNYKIAK